MSTQAPTRTRSRESAAGQTMNSNTEEREEAYLADESVGHRPAEGGGSAPMQPAKYQHSFWDPQIAHIRQVYIKMIVAATILMILMMWFALPVYWGSLGETSEHVPNLKGWVINRDGDGALGQAIVQAFEANSRGEGVAPKQHLTWIIVDPSQYPSNDDVAYAVVDEKAWAAVVVNTAATQALLNARSTGNSSYDPLSAISFYYNQGRNEVAANSFIVPLTTQLLQTTLGRFNAMFTGQWLASVTSTDVVTTASRAPQTVSQPFAVTPINLRPFTKTVSTAILLVGQIYVTIFAFVITMAHDAARGVISPFLTFGSYAKMRLIVPMIAYIPISFSYAMINLPFKVTFGERFSYAGGFFIFWLYVYMGMAALGLSTEAMITLLTPRFIANFLLILIIYNVSVASVPIILQPSFYRWGYGFPVFNLSQTVRTIIFNTKSHMGLNAGVLICWIVLNFVTITAFTWFIRRRTINEEKSQERALDKDVAGEKADA
ncbi:hypothetical protein FS837_002639 [Tulasnella sp. UAMH 9824]|nr:hypothetical protein FS837_002639 [Tulasnella sp. UAMH 9824]